MKLSNQERIPFKQLIGQLKPNSNHDGELLLYRFKYID